MDRNTPTHSSSHNGQTGLGQTTSAHSSSTASWVDTVPHGKGDTQTPNGAQNTRDSISLQCFRCQGWGHMAGECVTLAKTLNKDRGTQGNVFKPPVVAVNKLATFPSWPQTKSEPNEGSQEERATRSHPTPFLNPTPIAQLVEHSNKMPVVIDGQDVTALIELGAQVLSISTQFCKDLTLPIQPLGQLLELEGTEGAAIPYLGFVEVNLQIPGMRNYSKDVLLLVIPTMTYSKTVSVVVGSKIIDKALSLLTMGELKEATTTWRQAHFEAVMLGSLQLSHSSSGESEMGERANCSSQKSDSVEVQKFWLDYVKGLVCTTQKVTILPFSTINVWANTSVRGHCMWAHVLTELVLSPQLPAAVVPAATYGVLCPGSSRVPICLHNLSTCAVEVPAKTVVGQVAPANQELLVAHPTRAAKETNNPSIKRVGLGGFRPQRSHRVAQIRAEMG